MSNLNRKQSRFFSAGLPRQIQSNADAGTAMERTSPQSNATSPSARTVVSALGSPERADPTVSPSSMRSVKQQGSPPSAPKFNQQVSPSSMRSVKQLGSPPSAPNFNQQVSPSSTRSVSQQVSPLSTRSVSQESSAPAENSNRRPQHTRVSSTDSVTTVVNAPASPDGGVSLRETTGADALDDVFISPRQRGTRHHGSDTTNAVASGVEGHEYVTTPPRHVPSPTGTVASISSTKRTPSRPSIAGANFLSPREELARSESARRNFMPPSFSDGTNATDPDLNLLAPGFGSETAALRASKRLSAQNLQAMFEQGEDAQNDINKLLAEEMKLQKEDVNNLVELARVQRRRVNTVQERTEQLEQFTVETNADLQRRLAAVEEQMTAMRVRSAQTTPVLDQFGQFLPGVSYSHPGHLQPPPIHNHPAFQPRSQHSSQAPGGQRNFHVNMMQMPAPSFNVQEPLQLAPGLETPKAKIITMPASGARIDGDKPSAVTPNPTDDVFGPRAPAAPSAPVGAGPSYGACAPGPLPKAQFGQKTFRELLSSLYSRSEMAVRQYFRGNFQVRGRDPRAVHLFKLAHTHLNGKQAAENMLAEPDTRVYLFIGMVHEWLVTNIYHQALLDGYADAPSAVRINELFNKEAWYQQSGAIYAMEFGQRRQLATERTSLCQKVAQQPGFWKWVQQVSTALSDEFLTTFSLVIPVHLLPRARDEFHKIIHDVTKVAVRMRQEPFFFEIIFYRFGVRWDHKRMIQRNDEFLGLAMDEDPPQHVVRATLVPCVIQKGFEGNTLQMEQILKGEVVLTDRQGNLR